MVAELNILSVNLATACMESFLYGIFCILSGTSTYLLLRRGREQMAAGMSSRPMWRTPMFIAGCLIALTVTGHWILTVVRLFDAFVNYKGGAEPIIAFADLSMMTEVIKTAFLVVTVLISDAMIIYRLYIVWSYNKFIIIFPVMTWCGLIACGTGVCWQFAVYTLGDDVFKTSAGRWITSDCVFTFTTNIYCSLLIAYRVWRTRITTQAYGGANIMGALAIIIESAALQSCVLRSVRSALPTDRLPLLSRFPSQQELEPHLLRDLPSEEQHPVHDVRPLGADLRDLAHAHQPARRARLGARRRTRARRPAVPRVTAVSQARSYASAADQNFAMRPLAVNITRVVNQEDDFGGMKKADYSSQGSILPV
ncbi:hypothetical protein EVJ58_g8291 [Rhodofomes roseus]|uniref:Uncharacterized protein n=1 Tax=Rhodofomes roseus TaxID=34475 RepID=A0A4Y9XZ10_9APHY|nr:hypothetical protein EVJ58_g8291 [Rhodofomes roseus]